MIVAIAATQLEMEPFLAAVLRQGGMWPTCVTGVGPVETAVRLGAYVHNRGSELSGILQFGVGGAYFNPQSAHQAGVLDVFLAATEVLGDCGICFPDRMEYLAEDLDGVRQMSLASPLLDRAEDVLKGSAIDYRLGHFVTVNGVSGTAARGRMLQEKWQGLCENMEGAAAARVCLEYGLPLLEIRVVSNMVEDRDRGNWQLSAACIKAGEIAAFLMKELT